VNYVRKNIAAMAGYTPGEQPTDPAVVKLNTNENPYPPSPRVLEAIGRAAENLRKYPDPLGTEVRRTVARLFDVAAEMVICGNGSDDLLTVAARAFTAPGRPLAACHPTYSLYETLAELQDAPFESHECPADFSLPVEALASSKAPLVILANPNAPTGLAAPVAALERIARGIPGVLLVDEAYVDFAADNALRLARSERNVLVMRTLSKSYSLAGLRFGFMVGPAEIIAELMKVKDSYNCDGLALAAARAALEDQDWMRENVRRIVQERARLGAALGAMKFTVLDSQSNFLLVRPPKVAAEELYERLKGRGILVRYFHRPRVRDYVRITVGTPQESDRLLAEIAAVLR
jgi:histidinol-phosphate aminotransferase